uniref:ribonuclease H n=1 Tax=Gopherus agassizii TaxID=38772 RepID=A0A452H228_9SAUR
MESFAVAYIDDICVFSQTWEDHLFQVKQVLDRLRNAGLTVKAEKCKVGMAEVSYLGHRVGSGCLKPEPAKICKLPAEPGPCFTYMSRYFYNSVTKRCEEFVYGGCQGNGNRFPNMDECLQTCGSSGKRAIEIQLVGL